MEQGDTVDSKILSALSNMQGKRGGNALRPARKLLKIAAPVKIVKAKVELRLLKALV